MPLRSLYISVSSLHSLRSLANDETAQCRVHRWELNNVNQTEIGSFYVHCMWNWCCSVAALHLCTCSMDFLFRFFAVPSASSDSLFTFWRWNSQLDLFCRIQLKLHKMTTATTMVMAASGNENEKHNFLLGRTANECQAVNDDIDQLRPFSPSVIEVACDTVSAGD